MYCRYCESKMIRTQHYPRADFYDFEESYFICPNCESECSYGEPWGYDWFLGDISKFKSEIEFHKCELNQYRDKILLYKIPIFFEDGFHLSYTKDLGWVASNIDGILFHSNDWKEFKEMVNNEL